MRGMPDDEVLVVHVDAPEPGVGHAPFDGVEPLECVRGGQVLEEEARGGEERVSSAFGGCGDGGEVLEPFEGVRDWWRKEVEGGWKYTYFGTAWTLTSLPCSSFCTTNPNTPS